MASALGDMTDFQFDFDAMNLDPNAFPDQTRSDCDFDFSLDSIFGSDVSFDDAGDAFQLQSGNVVPSVGVASPELVSPTVANQRSTPQVQSPDPVWTPITPTVATFQQLPAIPFGWKPCSPPLLPVTQPQRQLAGGRPCSPPHTPELMYAAPQMHLKHFQYPDPDLSPALQSLPYLGLPPPSVPSMASAGHQKQGPTGVTSAPRPCLKRRRSMHHEDLYASDQESDSYNSYSLNLSSVAPSPSTTLPSPFTESGVKKGPKHKLEQTEERQAANERRRAYYYRVKQDPAWRARQIAQRHNTTASSLSAEPVKKSPKYRLEQIKERKAICERHKARYHNIQKHDPVWKAKQNALERERYHKRQAAKLGRPAEATQAIIPMEVVTNSARGTNERTKATKKPKPKWKGWVELSDEGEDPSKQEIDVSLPQTKKGKLAKEVEDTKEFSQARAQGEKSDSDDAASLDDDDGDRIISMDQPRKRARSGVTWVRRSRRAKQPVTYTAE